MPRKSAAKLTRAEKSELTKKKIINAGFELLKEKGYDNLTVRNICDHAVVSTGTFYHFYQTKDDLMSEFLKREDWIDDMEDPEDIVAYIICGYQNLIDAYETLGIDFTSNYYTASNQSFNIYTREPGKYTSDMVRMQIIKARQNGYIIDEVPLERIIGDIQVLVIGNVFLWCVVKGATDIRMDLERMLRDYLLAKVVSEKYIEKYVK